MIRTFVFGLSLLMLQSGPMVGRPRLGQVINRKQKVERAESQPGLAANIDDVAELKIASRKLVFQLGEMITLDVALLNRSPRPAFFRKLSDLSIVVLSSTGQTLPIQEYGVVDRAMTSAAFVQLQPGEISVQSFHLLAGCDKRAFHQFNSTEDDDLTVFKRGLFLNWGDACLPIMQPESYTLSAHLKNSFVLLPMRSGRLRTAVGAIKSNSLEMTISN